MDIGKIASAAYLSIFCLVVIVALFLSFIAATGSVIGGVVCLISFAAVIFITVKAIVKVTS